MTTDKTLNGGFDCYSCYHSTSDSCNLARQGYPDAGSKCAAFSYEPGTDAQERPSQRLSDYQPDNPA